ncbi:MAG TPA: SulP family inorganic anion transporter [Chromatiaceae bacterium]|nr:SulP family inorganic anion transporter [Chromatiaceae bacterium]
MSALPTKPLHPHFWLRAWLPFLRWWPRVNRDTLRDDLVAGLTGAVVVLPQGVAFATIAGMPPEYGLYAGMVPAIIAALFGSSWHLVSGPTTAASIVLFSILSLHAEPGSARYVELAFTLTFMVGLIQIALGAARLGALVNFISHSVVIGFTAGAAILIATNQVKNFFGLAIPRGSSFATTWGTLFSHLDQIDPYVTGVAVLTLVLGVAVRRWLPRWPYMIVAMVGGSLLGVAFQVSGVPGISTVGALPASLPPLSMPDLSLENLRELFNGAVAVTLLALTEAVSIARAMALRSGQHLDGNQEFIGQGLSNLIGSFFSGYVATGSFNRSGLNYAAGAKTPLASVFSALLLALIVLLVAPLAAWLPNAAMAGVLFLVAWGLIDFHHIQQIARTSRAETAILLTTFVATLTIELEEAIVIGVILSLVIYLSRTSRPQVVRRVPDPQHPQRKFSRDPALPECPQLKLVRIDGSLFFGAVSAVRDQFHAFAQRSPSQCHLIVVASPINFVDVAGAEFLTTEARQRRARGGGLYFIQMKRAVRDTLERGGYLDEIGAENLFRSKGEAIATVFNRLDPEVCRACRLRVFLECGQTPGTVRIPELARRQVDGEADPAVGYDGHVGLA